MTATDQETYFVDPEPVEPVRISKGEWAVKIKEIYAGQGDGYRLAIADQIRYGYDWFNLSWHETFEFASKHTKVPVNTLKNWKWVAAGYPAEVRKPNVSWIQYRLLRELPETERWKWLERIESNGHSASELRKLLTKTREVKD